MLLGKYYKVYLLQVIYLKFQKGERAQGKI